MIKLKRLLIEVKFKSFKDLYKTMPSQLQKRIYNLKKIKQRKEKTSKTGMGKKN